MSDLNATTASDASTNAPNADAERSDLARRVVELETRLAFQEHAQTELSDALAELRAEAARGADSLRRVLEELKLHRGDLMADPVDEPPPPHY